MAISAKRTRTIVARRQDLIDGTIRSIAEHGYANSTVRTICESVGLSRGLIGQYFQGKDDLLLEAFRHMCARSDERMRHAIESGVADRGCFRQWGCCTWSPTEDGARPSPW